ncbi:MAG: VCBS repeat-containing protein [Chloroflexales bacterium]|nr:VCBS repeat-containing protein [Chloroflexales bacterium]
MTPSSTTACRSLVALLVAALLCAGCAGAPSPADATTAATTSQALQGSAEGATMATMVSQAVAATMTAPTPTTPPSPTPYTPVITDLEPFLHEPTGLTGLRPVGWAFEELPSGFTTYPGLKEQGSFTATLTATGEPVTVTRALFERLKGPDMIVTEENRNSDGGRLIVVDETGLTTYARVTLTDRGLLTLVLSMPTDQALMESFRIREMLDSIKLSGEYLTEVACRYGFTSRTLTSEDAWMLPADQLGDSLDPINYFDAPALFAGSSIGDFDGDGRQDLALVTSVPVDMGNQLMIFLQGEDGAPGRPTCFSIGWTPRTLASGDLNSDGRDDVVVGGQGSELNVFLSAEEALFGTRRSYASGQDATALAVADLNGDGRDDVVASFWNSDVVGLFLQQERDGPGEMIGLPAKSGGINDLAVGDVSGDGLPDIIAQPSSGVQVYLQQPDHSFATSVAYQSSRRSTGVAVGDLTGDGRNDVVISAGDNVVGSWLIVFEQSAGGTLVETASYSLFRRQQAVELADLDGDERLDVVVLHEGEHVLSVLHQQGDGTLAPAKLYLALSDSANPQAMDIGDLNGNGQADIVVAGAGFTVFYGRVP